MKRIITLIALLTLFATDLQAQIIDTTNNSSHKKEKIMDNSPIYKPTGHYLRFEAGFPNLFSIGYSYQIVPCIMTGGGLALIVPGRFGSQFGSHSIYAETVFSTPHYRWSPNAGIKLGYFHSYGVDECSYSFTNTGIFVTPTIGCNYKNFSICLGFEYQLFQTSYDNRLHYDDIMLAVFLSYNLPMKYNASQSLNH